MPDVNTPGAQVTDLSQFVAPQPQAAQGFASRVWQAARFVISGVSPATWFGPMQPLKPMAPSDVGGRQFDYQVGFNLNYQPRSNEAVSFAQLRDLATSCDVLALVIEARLDQMSAMDWAVRPKMRSRISPDRMFYDPRKDIEGDKLITDDQRMRIAGIDQFLQFPDKEHSWDQWQRAILADLLIIDAPTIYRRYNRGGTLHALEYIDGATIKPLLNADGRRPQFPDPAYQQILHGVPAADFTMEELLYIPRNVRTNKVYGFSPVEQIIMTVNTAIRRSLSQLDYYLEGTQPDAFVGLPKEWNMEAVKGFQVYFDALMSGMLGKRRKVRFMPGEFKYQETKQPPLKDQYDEWLARIICFAFSVDPTPFISQTNRSVAETSKTRALEEGKKPTQRWFKNVMDRILAEDFGSPDLEFLYLETVEQDAKTQMEIDVGYTKSGIRSIDEVRADRGWAVWGGPYAVPMIATNVGFIPVDYNTNPLYIEQKMKVAQATLGDKGEGKNQEGDPETQNDGPSSNNNENNPSSSSSPPPKSQPFSTAE